MTDNRTNKTLPEKSVFSRRTVLKTAGIGAAGITSATALAACSSKEAIAELDAATVSFVYLGSADQAASFDALFAGFRELFPQIDFKANAYAAREEIIKAPITDIKVTFKLLRNCSAIGRSSKARLKLEKSNVDGIHFGGMENLSSLL